jgi:hypothetical protein
MPGIAIPRPRVLRSIHEQRRDTEPPERPGNGELVGQGNVTVPESGVIRLPPDG